MSDSTSDRRLTTSDGRVDRGAFYGRVGDLTRQQADRRAASPYVPRERRGGSAVDRGKGGRGVER